MTTPTLSFTGAADTYRWTRDRVQTALAPLPDLQNPVSDGLDAGLDDLVRMALDATGLMDRLEEVTGDLAALTAAAQEWQEQARAMHDVADTLRAGGADLAGRWEGEASGAFGRHMGEVVQAIDDTAADMDQVAQIISQAAAECRLAEELVVEIIREAIEALIISLAVMVVVDIVTLGAATIVNALVAEAEIAVFVARVGRVSVKLEKALKRLFDAVKEIETAGKSLGNLKKGWKAAKAVRKIGGRGNRWESGMNALRNPTVENIGEYAAAKGVQQVFGAVKGGLKGGLGAVTGAGDFAGAVTGHLGDDTVVDGLAGRLDGTYEQDPYRVPANRIEEAFG
ncbi:hypothetical protein KNE206_76090 [Kitasatospora sp. NE20-6]|uniref:WXG100 family type VII secretion target n=1 Tax=Kitasatospora sp. NE20-6 TaxID=2859066 RepID=UPI0034DCA9BC